MQAIARIIVAFLFLIPAAVIDAKEANFPHDWTGASLEFDMDSPQSPPHLAFLLGLYLDCSYSRHWNGRH